MRRQYDKRQAERVVLPRLAAPRVSATPAFSPTKKRVASSFFKKIGGFFKKLFRKPAPWELKVMAEAEAKRAYRKIRNIAWWSKDQSWEFYGRTT